MIIIVCSTPSGATIPLDIVCLLATAANSEIHSTIWNALLPVRLPLLPPSDLIFFA